jgi:dienelactone hydrolase
MRRVLLIVVLGSLLPAAVLADQPEAAAKSIADALKELDPRVVPEAEREAIRAMVGRSLREQIAAANRQSSQDWAQIKTRDDWERFRREKIDALRKSLGTLPERPAIPPSLVTGEIAGDGFVIRNLVYQSRPGLVVTANLYVPQPARDSMPGIVLAHSHHNPKTEGELQDMGMTWARAGCYVLVPDALGHGERRQHPFETAADYPKEFAVGRQDYNFRYDTSLQLYLVGQSLMGWMVHDLMTGVDLLLAQPNCDPKRIALLGAVAGGGDPAGVTAALDARITCVVPFNFGGPQPENRYPLPDDAETSFNYAGGGSWESTRNLGRSAADGFLPWVIVGSVAPRHLIHAHEFSWDGDRDPVWKRYLKIFNFYERPTNLAVAHGYGTIQVNDPPGSHCNNIGAAHRKQIHGAFRAWFGIDVKPEDEYRNRRPREELMCLTEAARKQFDPKPLHEILSATADAKLAAAREARAKLSPEVRRKAMRESWTRLLGESQPPQEVKVREGSPHLQQIGAIKVTRELLESEPGITVPVMILSLSELDSKTDGSRPLVLGVASDGLAAALERRQDDIAQGLGFGCVIVLVDVRGTGAARSGADRGQQSAATSYSATSLMLGQTMLGGQLRDLRTAYRHIRQRKDVAKNAIVVGGSGIEPLPEDAPFSYPRRIDGRPDECAPTGALLAMLLGLMEDDVGIVACRQGLVSYRSILESPFVQVPHECIVPGVLAETDLSDLLAALAPRDVRIEAPVDGRGRLVSLAQAQAANELALRAYAQAGTPKGLQFLEPETADSKTP